MNKTPRTDEMLREYDSLEHGAACHIILRQSIEELETELAEALGEIKGLRQLVNDCHIVAGQLETERNEARAEIERLKTPMITDMREKMAALCHDQWAGWMEYLFLKSKQVDGCVIIPAWAVERWRRQVATRYPDLTEDEKNSDRNEADRFLSIFNAEIERKDKLIEQMRAALLWLYRWVKAEAEHFQANTPDDEIIKEVEAALSAAERGE